MPHSLPAYLTSCALAAATLSACSADRVVPYYRFTTADRAWQSFQPGTVWTFVSSRGAQNRFRVDSAVAREHRPEYIRTFSGGYSDKVNFYYDSWYLRVSSLDSAGQVGNFRLTVGAADNGSQLSADCDWATFIGVDSHSGGFVPCWLNFPADLRQVSFQELTVSGRRYSHVLTQAAVGRPTRATPYGVRTSVRQLSYDQQAGVIQLVEADEVWNRVP